MFQKITPFLLCILLLLLSACNQSLPDQMPDLGMNADELEFNKYISLAAPKECNTYKPGDEVCLEVKNLTEKVLTFNITTDIFIYQYENNQWQKVSDDMINLGDLELTLGSNGDYLLDTRFVGVLPDVEFDQPANLRVMVIAHDQALEKEAQEKGAFIDLLLRP